MANVVEGLFQNITAIFHEPHGPLPDFTAVLVPLNFIDAGELFMNGEFTVDWGDGVPIAYDNEEGSEVPTGDVTLVGGTGSTFARLAGTGVRVDRWLSVDIQGIGLVSSFVDMCRGLESMETFTTVDPVGLTSMRGLFWDCFALDNVAVFDTSAVLFFDDMFRRCLALSGTLPLFDTSSALSMDRMFFFCTSVTGVPLFDTANCTGFRTTFQNCQNPTFPLFDMSSALDCSGMIRGNTALTECPDWDLSGVTDMTFFAFGNTSMTIFNPVDFTACTDFESMLQNCSALLVVGNLVQELVADFGEMFRSCTSLTTIGAIDTAAGGRTTFMFATTSSLTSPNAAEQLDILNGFDFN